MPPHYNLVKLPQIEYFLQNLMLSKRFKNIHQNQEQTPRCLKNTFSGSVSSKFVNNLIVNKNAETSSRNNYDSDVIATICLYNSCFDTVLLR